MSKLLVTFSTSVGMAWKDQHITSLSETHRTGSYMENIKLVWLDSQNSKSYESLYYHELHFQSRLMSRAIYHFTGVSSSMGTRFVPPTLWLLWRIWKKPWGLNFSSEMAKWTSELSAFCQQSHEYLVFWFCQLGEEMSFFIDHKMKIIKKKLREWIK